MSRPQSSNPDTTNELREEIEKRVNLAMKVAKDNQQSNSVPMLKDTTNIIMQAIAAQKQRWEAAARKDEDKRWYRAFSHRSFYYRDEVNKHLSDRIAALDGVIGEQP